MALRCDSEYPTTGYLAEGKQSWIFSMFAGEKSQDLAIASVGSTMEKKFY